MPRRPAFAILLSAVALAACGGGGSTSHAPTKAAYTAKADAICRTAHAQTNRLIAQIKALAPKLLIGGVAAAPSAPGLVAKLHTVSAANLARLRALATPSGDSAAIAAFLDPLSKVVTEMGKALAELRAGKAVDAAVRFSNAIPTAQAVRTAATAYGLKACASLLDALS